MSRSFSTLEELRSVIGEHLGFSEWVVVAQQRIDTFAAATGDHQWIHVDPDRAASGPFGSTVAHGYLTMALLPALVGSIVQYDGWAMKVNYGSNKVRFPAPVPVDSRVRAGVSVADVQAVAAGAMVTSLVTVELADADGTPTAKPALVAETLTLLALPVGG